MILALLAIVVVLSFAAGVCIGISWAVHEMRNK